MIPPRDPPRALRKITLWRTRADETQTMNCLSVTAARLVDRNTELRAANTLLRNVIGRS
jgi:hypothetical protein